MSRPQLVSFDVCPFVQRAVIMLRHKQIEFDVEYIDLANKPAWFLAISPLGKVPLLRVGETVLFESAVINEYLDEVYGPPMMPSEPLQRAQARGWVIFAGEMMALQYRLMTAPDARTWDEVVETLVGRLAHFEGAMGEGPYFGGAELGVVDAAIAPAFLRFDILEGLRPHGILTRLPRLRAYADALARTEAVCGSVPADFEARLHAALVKMGGYVTAT